MDASSADLSPQGATPGQRILSTWAFLLSIPQVSDCGPNLIGEDQELRHQPLQQQCHNHVSTDLLTLSVGSFTRGSGTLVVSSLVVHVNLSSLL